MKESYNADVMKTHRLILDPIWQRSRCSFTSSTSFTSFHYCVRFNLHQHFRRNEFAHFHHAGCRPDIVENFSVVWTRFLQLRDVVPIDSRRHDVPEGRSGRSVRGLDAPSDWY